MDFSTILGHQALKEQLYKLVETNRVPQVQLISGPQGSAVLPFALAFATYLHCAKKSHQGACGQCASCQKASKYLHPDLYFAFPLGNTSKSSASKKHSQIASTLLSWRSFLLNSPYQGLQEWATHVGQRAKQMKITTIQIEEIIAFLRTHAIESQYKIVMIWLPEHIHATAAHKLLKTLEEPPANAIFILASHDVSQILPTLASRTWPLNIPPFQDEDIIKAVTKKYPNMSTAKLSQIADGAAGNLHLAYNLASEETSDHFPPLAKWLRSVYAHQWTDMVEEAERFEKSSPTEQKIFISYTLRLMRASLMAQCDLKKGEPLSEEEVFCHKFGHTISLAQLEKLIHALEMMYFKLTRNAHPKLLFLTTSLSMANSLRPFT